MVRIRPLMILMGTALLGWFIFHKPMGKTYFLPFEDAQIQDHYSPKDLILFYEKIHKKKWRTVRRLYNAHVAGKLRHHKKEKIPKIIHQIWLDKEIPPSIQKIQTTWQEKHPDWEYHLWTKEQIALLYLQNRTQYESAKTAKKKSEVLRYEILYQFGGVFVENDLECVKSLDILNENLNFYAGLQDQIKTPALSAALIGATPSNPIIHSCLYNIRIRNPDNPGSFLLTEGFFSNEKKDASVALPTSFFFPQKAQQATFAIEKNGKNQ